MPASTGSVAPVVGTAPDAKNTTAAPTVVTATTILDRLRAAGVTVSLRRDGRIETRGRVPAELVPALRRHRDEVAAELRRAIAPEATGELAALDREAALLRRVSIGLGTEIDAVLWRVLDRVLLDRDLELADRLWSHVVAADRRGIFSRLVGWLRSLDAAGGDQGRVRELVDAGPGRHAYHDEGVTQ